MTDTEPIPKPQSVIGNWRTAAHWSLILGTFLAMLAWSWGTWPDALIDYGRELYVPWRITRGDVLYRDIVDYFNGPLSPYLDALLFKIFGASLLTLVLFNVLVVLGIVVLLHWLIREAAGIFAATACGIAFLVLFAFAQITRYGNYNFICAYSSELPHGIALTLAAIACLHCWHRTQYIGWLAATGALLGLVFLTKAEIFAAALAGIGAGFVAELWTRRASLWRVIHDCGILLGYALAPVVIALLLLMIHLAPAQAMRGALGAWNWIGDQQLLRLPYFQDLAGTLDIHASITAIAMWSLGYCGVFVIPVFFAMSVRNRSGAGYWIAATIFLVWMGAGYLWWEKVAWTEFARPLPLFLSIAAIVGFIALARRKSDNVLLFVLLIWAIAMLAKIRLNVQIYHYGFALAMPGTIVLIALLIGWLPSAIDRAGGSGIILRSAAAAALIVVIGAHLYRFHGFWSPKQFVLGEDSDAFLTDAEHDPRPPIIKRAVDLLARLQPPNGTVAVMPEGLMINYLTRRVNPTGYGQFTPPAIMMFGEDLMLEAFQQHPPDYVMLTAIDESEYGTPSFGRDYGKKIWTWIEQNYSQDYVFGSLPFRERGFGIELMKRRRPTTATTR